MQISAYKHLCDLPLPESTTKMLESMQLIDYRNSCKVKTSAKPIRKSNQTLRASPKCKTAITNLVKIYVTVWKILFLHKAASKRVFSLPVSEISDHKDQNWVTSWIPYHNSTMQNDYPHKRHSFKKTHKGNWNCSEFYFETSVDSVTYSYRVFLH